MAIASTTLDELVRDLEHELGPGVVTRDGTRLGAYGADTYWPALAAQAQAAPLGVPDLAVTPEREEDVATCVRLANRYGVPVIAWGGGSGSQGVPWPSVAV